MNHLVWRMEITPSLPNEAPWEQTLRSQTAGRRGYPWSRGQQQHFVIQVDAKVSAGDERAAGLDPLRHFFYNETHKLRIVADRIRFYKEDLDFGLWVWERIGYGRILTLALLHKARLQGWDIQLMPGMATGPWAKHWGYSLSGIDYLKLRAMTSFCRALRLTKAFLGCQPSGLLS